MMMMKYLDAVRSEPGNSVDLELKPVTETAFTAVYDVATTFLEIPKQIDLGAN
jgi:hypothetical protein